MTETQKTDAATMDPDGTAAAIAADDRLRAVRMRGATVSVVRQVTLLPALIVLVIVGSIVARRSSPAPTSPASGSRCPRWG